MRAALAAVLLFSAQAALAKKALPPPPASYVYNEHVVGPQTEARLYRRLRGLEEQTGRQFVVALFQSLDGESLEDYANKLFRAWAPGSKKGNDGLLFCLFKRDKRWRVEVGYGLEGTLTDLEAADIVRSRAVSYFTAGDFDTGVFAGVDGLAGKLGGTVETRIRPRRAGRPRLDTIGSWLGLLFVLGFALLFFVAVMAASARTIGRRATAGAAFDVLNLLLNILFLFLGGGGGGSGGGGGGGFSGGGGSSGGGGASGDW